MPVTIFSLSPEDSGEKGTFKMTHGNRKTINQMNIVVKSIELFGKLFLELYLPVPKIGSLSCKCRPATKVRKKMQPVASEIFPDTFIWSILRNSPTISMVITSASVKDGKKYLPLAYVLVSSLRLCGQKPI